MTRTDAEEPVRSIEIAGFSNPQFSVEPTADELTAARAALEESHPDVV